MTLSRNVVQIPFNMIAFVAVSPLSAAPPILVSENANRIPFEAQIYDASPVDFDIQTLSIAEQYRWAAKWDGSIPDITTNILCEISDNGEVKPLTCEAESWSDREQQLAMKLARQSSLSSFPKFPAIDRDALGLAPRGKVALWSKLVRFSAKNVPDLPFFRLVRLPAHIERVPLAVDLTTGPLVDIAQINFLSGNTMKVAHYPTKALREGLEGTQLVECQVQVDRSIICRSKAFDPPENGPYFVREGSNLLRDAIAREQLKNGSSSVGVRFQIRLRWRLPSA